MYGWYEVKNNLILPEQPVQLSDNDGNEATFVIEALKEFQEALDGLECRLRDIEDSAAIIEGALEAARQFYRADRAYVLEIDSELHVGVNTYECTEGKKETESVYQQRIPLELLPRLEQALKQNQPLIIRDIEEIRGKYPSEYEELKRQGIGSLIATPFSKRINSGFIVVDNPKKYGEDPRMLLLLSYVIVLELNEIKQKRSLDMAEKRVSKQAPKEIYVNMFGRFEVIAADGVLNDDDFSAEQGCNLLAYLIMNRRNGCSARLLCEALWPDMDSDDPYNAIKSAVYRLRSTLSCVGLRELIMASHGTFVLNPEYSIITDIDRFDEACRKIGAATKPENLKRLYQSVMSLYRGSLLSGHDSFQWILPKAVYYQNKYLQLLKDYIGVLNQAKDYLEIQRIASEALTIDMQNGDIHFYMIQAILDQGNRSVARMQFRQAERFMDDEQVKVIRQRLQNRRALGA